MMRRQASAQGGLQHGMAVNDSSPFLEDPDLMRLTGRRQKSRQIEWLRSEGIPFRVNATGHPVVLWSALEDRNTRVDERWAPRALEA